VAVEHKAILHSQADFIVYLIDGRPDLYQIGRQTLIDLLNENWTGDRRWHVLRGGEFHDWMTLIPAREFIGMCTSL
jgi:hypothetical protein